MPGIDTSEWDTAYLMFRRCQAHTIYGLNYLDTSTLKTFHGMFENCNKLKRLDLREWDTRSAQTMDSLFYDTTSLEEVLVSRDKWVVNPGCNISSMWDGSKISAVTYYN